jgi:pyruvate/2-oxoglutarate/acetoin dehydrogenase E1 component
MSKISYGSAINKALHLEMDRDESVVVYGIGVNEPGNIFGTTSGLLDKFGQQRVFDSLLCEDAMMGFTLGAAVCGLRPVCIHIRVDFLLLAMNQLVNMISSFTYGTAGKQSVPLVIRAVIGRGWGQGYQHSKSLFSYFTHIPGLKVIAPSTPADAVGLLRSAIRDDNPVIVFEHRWLYWAEEDVPEDCPQIEIGKGHILRSGNDITIVAMSWMTVEALHAARILESTGVSVEVVDPRTLRPLDIDLILASVRKTGHLVVTDGDWLNSGFSAEICTQVTELAFSDLKSAPRRLGFADCPCPTVRVLENGFYPNAGDIVRTINIILERPAMDLSDENFFSHEHRFKGPF